MIASKLILEGCVGTDPSIINTKGHKIAKVRLAVSIQEFDNQAMEIKTRTEWHTIVFLDDIANLAEQYITKGTRLSVNGYPKEREWIDKEGQKHISREINASEFRIRSNSNINQ